MDSLIFCKFLRGVFHDFYEESAEILTSQWLALRTEDEQVPITVFAPSTPPVPTRTCPRGRT